MIKTLYQLAKKNCEKEERKKKKTFNTRLHLS